MDTVYVFYIFQIQNMQTLKQCKSYFLSIIGKCFITAHWKTNLKLMNFEVFSKDAKMFHTEPCTPF